MLALCVSQDIEVDEDLLRMMVGQTQKEEALFGLKVVAEEVNHQMLYQ